MDDEIRQSKLTKSAITAAIREYASEQPELKPVMAFYREIFGVQKRHAAGLPLQFPKLSREEIELRFEARKPLLRPRDLQPATAELREVMRDICAAIEAKSPHPPAGLKTLTSGKLGEDEWLVVFKDSYLEGKTRNFTRISREAGIEPDLGTLIAHTSLAPFYWKSAAGMRPQVSLAQVASGACPICSARPIMGFIRPDDGMRVLECSLCGTRWGAPRMACAFCRTQDRTKLRYHFAEGDADRRVYVCDNCKGYLKVTDMSGKAGDLVIPLEDMATALLDEVAQERGYKRACSSVFG